MMHHHDNFIHAYLSVSNNLIQTDIVCILVYENIDTHVNCTIQFESIDLYW